MTATMMPPADLTPAVDKFVRLPDVPHAAAAVSPYTMTAKGPVPDGPDPFKYVADELSPLSEFVKELVVSENPVLTMAASHFFEKVSVVNVVEMCECRVQETLALCFVNPLPGNLTVPLFYSLFFVCSDVTIPSLSFLYPNSVKGSASAPQ